MVLTMSGPAIENGPGPQCTSPLSSCDTTGTISFTRSSASCSHGFSSRRRHTTCMNVPPGLSDLRTLRIAAPGISKNIVPKRANAWSYGPCRSPHCASPTKKRALSAPAWRASASAARTKFSAQSTPTASPVGPTRLAMRTVLSPKPQPTSSTRAPSG